MSGDQTKRRRYGLALYVNEQGARKHSHHNGAEAIARIGEHILLDPRILDTYHYDGWNPVHQDLLIVCAAVEYADRQCARRSTRWSRLFHITVPVLEPAAWRQPGVQPRLQQTLRHLTGDDWHFSFVQAANSILNGMHQRPLPFGSNKKFAIAYSRGLDSCCVSGLFDTDDSVIRVRVAPTKDQVRKGEQPFDLVPFRVKPTSSRESTVRSRGFKFAAITAIAGHISGVTQILVPESGQGSLGPVLLPLHNIYADYRVHPTFLRSMERFIKELLGYSIAYKQPRLWSTKGQTIEDYCAHSEKKLNMVLNTRSCWQQRWNARLDGKRRQCGLCAACLLRRMSMHAARVIEADDTYVFNDLTADCYQDAIPQSDRFRLSRTMVEHGSVGARHLQQLGDLAEQPDSALGSHVFEIARATNASAQDTRHNLRKLLVRHANEWRDFVAAQGEQSFLLGWTKGGRYVRSE